MMMSPSLLRAVLPILVVLLATSGGSQAFVGVHVHHTKQFSRTSLSLSLLLSPLQAATKQTQNNDALLPLASSKVSSSPQLLEFREPTTGVLVKLVGCMHYNPTSIQLTADTINELGRDNRLGSVVIESCDIRWNQTKAFNPAVQALLQSEMKTACDLAMGDYQRPVILGDQRINITVAGMKSGAKETLTDLSTPWNGGWGRYWSNVTMARAEALPFGSTYLSPFSFLDPKLLLGLPVSLIKYPLSYFFKAPLQTTAFFALVFAVDQQATADAATLLLLDDTTTTTTTALGLQDYVGSLAVAALEIAFFARIFLKDLLVERNKLLAQNILEQCKLYQTTTTTAAAATSSSASSTLVPFWSSIFGDNKKARSSSSAMEVVYVQDPGKPTRNDPGDDKAVVAVLGMAHCNGIMKLLQDQKV
jgi:hypothetical protein